MEKINGQSARRLLKTGWEAQNLKFRYMQDKRLMPADRHLANLMMDTMPVSYTHLADMELWYLRKMPSHSMLLIIHRKNLRRKRIIMN